MTSKVRALLAPFYLGAVNEGDRLLVERELLCDPEVLLDYLDIKRLAEAAVEIPSQPSALLWQRLQARVQRRKKLWISLSMGMAIAAGVAFFYLTNTMRSSAATAVAPLRDHPVLFDRLHELPASSNVL